MAPTLNLVPPHRSRRNAATWTGGVIGQDHQAVFRLRVQVNRVFKLSSVWSTFFDIDPSQSHHVKSFYTFVPRPPCTRHVQQEHSGTTDQQVHPRFERENENLTGCFADRPPSFEHHTSATYGPLVHRHAVHHPLGVHHPIRGQHRCPSHELRGPPHLPAHCPQSPPNHSALRDAHLRSSTHLRSVYHANHPWIRELPGYNGSSPPRARVHHGFAVPSVTPSHRRRECCARRTRDDAHDESTGL